MYFSKLKYVVSLLKKYSLFTLIFVTSISDYILSKYAGYGILKNVRFKIKYWLLFILHLTM